MSEIVVNVIDARRRLYGNIHGSRFDYLVAALGVDPETIEELEAGLRRFVDHDEAATFFRHFHQGGTEEPWDAGIAVIDLPARVVAFDSTYSSPGRTGAVAVRIQERQVGLHYCLSDDWQITDMATYRVVSERHRAERPQPFDARAILYGRVTSVFARECLALAGSLAAPIIVPAGEAEPSEFPDDFLSHFDDDALSDELIAVHARWLDTPREDLRGQAPRDVLLARQRHINLDLQYRAQQWSVVGGCPPLLSRDTVAYRHGGFGTHEFVLYYYLLRFLLARAQDRLGRDRPSLDALSEYLERERDRWLNSPGLDMHGWTAAHVIDCERRRQPMAVHGDAAMIDCDCPLCQVMADSRFGQTFWHLDGCNMDDDFVFSSHRTRASWEEEQRDYAEFSRRFAEKERRRKELPEEPVWASSFAAPVEDDTPVEIILLGVGANLGELVERLQTHPEGQTWIDRLNREFGNLREEANELQADLAGAVVVRFVDALMTIADECIELEAKCASLQGRLYTIASRLARRAEDWDGPF